MPHLKTIFALFLLLGVALFCSDAHSARLYRALYSLDVPSGWDWEAVAEPDGVWIYGPNQEAVMFAARPAQNGTLQQFAEEQSGELRTGKPKKINNNCYSLTVVSPEYGEVRVLLGRLNKPDVEFYVFGNTRFNTLIERLFWSVKPGE